MFATSGKKQNKVYLWTLSPSTGELVYEPCSTGSFKRVYTDLAFSEDGQFLLAGSTSGDVTTFLVRNRGLSASITVCGGGVRNLVCGKDGSFFVGGGDGSLTHYERENVVSSFALPLFD